MKLKTFDEFLNEGISTASIEKDPNLVYDYGCAMLYFHFPQIKELHSLIRPDDVYLETEDKSYGLETKPHVTLLYGLHQNIPDEEVINRCKSIPIGELTLYNPSLFESDKYDVLKFDVKNDNLFKVNKRLCELPFTTDYPEYHPHATIGYLKKGRGSHYADMMKTHTHQVKPEKIVYTKADGSEVIENL